MSAKPQKINSIQTFGPNGLVPNLIDQETNKETNIYNVDYHWIIDMNDLYNYYHEKLKNGQPWKSGIRSKIFNSGTNDGSKWYLEFYPNGKTGVSNENLLYLHLDPTSDIKTVFGKFKISIIPDKKYGISRHLISYKSKVVRKFKAELHQGWGVSSLIRNVKSMLNDKLIIYCTVKYSATESDFFSNVSESRVSKNLEQLFKNEEFTDVVLSVNGKEYKVHKLILIAHSPVFAAMFNHANMKESQQNKIEITDFEESIVEEMLNYIYAGRPENLKNMADGLLIAAEKYGLDGLKDMSEKELMENLSVENAVDMLKLAETHGAVNLKSFCINFIVKNFEQVEKTNALENIASSYPKLIIEVLKLSVSHKSARS